MELLNPESEPQPSDVDLPRPGSFPNSLVNDAPLALALRDFNSIDGLICAFDFASDDRKREFLFFNKGDIIRLFDQPLTRWDGEIDQDMDTVSG